LEPIGERSHEQVPGDVHHRGVHEPCQLGRDAPVELVAEQHELVERAGHPPHAARDAPDERVVGEHHHRCRGVPDGLRDGPHEAVAVEEDGVEVLVEEPRRDHAFEVVVPEVEVPEHGDPQHDVGERAHEPVVADVELVEQREAGEALGDDATEAVGVDVEERGVREQPQLGGEVPRDVAAVEVDPRDHRRVRVVQRLRARHAEVGAHVGAAPVAGEVLRVGVDGAAQGLQRDVRAAEAVVGEGHVHADVELEVVREVAVVVLALLAEGEQLTTRDQGGLRVRQRRGGGGRRREQEEEEHGGKVVDEGAADAGGLHGGARRGSADGRPPLAPVPIWWGRERYRRRREQDTAVRWRACPGG
jgi:hypothetical protein